MARVSDPEVKQIIDTARDTTPFIDSANLIVDESLVGLTPALSAARLKQVELYLAAHFTAITEERGALTESETADSSEGYEVKVGEGLKATRYGQQAILLDSSGTLESLAEGGSSRQAEFRIV